MRKFVALVWDAPVPLIDIIVPCERYVEGLHEIGVQVITLWPVGQEDVYPYSTRAYYDGRELSSRELWRSLSCDAVAAKYYFGSFYGRVPCESA